LKNRLLIVGAGGHGRSVAEVALLTGVWELAGFIDDAAPSLQEVWGIPVLGTTVAFGQYFAMADQAVVAIGNNALRERLHGDLVAAGFQLPNLIHPRAVVSPRAKMGVGCTIMAGAIVGTEACLGDGVIVNSNAVIDHHCTVEDFGHLGVNGCMAGGSVLGHGAWMQAGSALWYGVRVPAERIIAPGVGVVASQRL
jgi:sugar O-acyltransferase (sialic acid O-acetyltransferase NeuD family)